MKSQNSLNCNNMFTKREWQINNVNKFKTAETHQEIADKILRESERVREQTYERTQTNKLTTDRRFEERIEDIKFNKKELQIQRKNVDNEVNELEIYKNRVENNIVFIQQNCCEQSKNCIILREKRIGIDLVFDDVEVALKKEINIIFSAQDKLKEYHHKIEEHMRRLRAIRYSIDHDLECKEYSLNLEKEGSELKPTDLLLSPVQENAFFNNPNIGYSEWNKFSKKNIDNASKEVANSRTLKTLTDALLKQVYEDLTSTNANCNKEFKKRIEEIRFAKTKLEDILNDIVLKINALDENIYLLEKAIADKQGYIALTTSRLMKRTQRPGIELVKDSVGHSLKVESEMLQLSTDQLKNTLKEAAISLRYLLQSRMQLEEEISIKNNSIKIDEVECMTLRNEMTYQQF